VTEATSQVPAVDDEHLDEVAHAIAKQWGDSEPTDITRVVGLQRQTAIAALTGGRVEDASGIVDVVQEHGDFVAPTAPPGRQAPTGHTLTIVVSRETGEATDFSLAEGSTPGQSLVQLGAGTPVPLLGQ
jgi:hypothetical protein